MKALISFTLKTRFGQLFGGKYAWLVNGWRLVWLFFGLVYGLLFAYIFTHGKPEKVNFSYLISVLNAIAFSKVMLRNFFPFYQFKKPFIPSIYPIKRWQGILLQIIYDCCSVFFVMGILVFGLSLLGERYSLQHFVESMLIIANAYFIERLLKKYIEERFEDYVMTFGIFITLVIGFIMLHLWMPNAYIAARMGYSLGLLGFVIVFISLNIFLENKRSVFKSSHYRVSLEASSKPMTLANSIIPYYFKNKKIRTMIIMYLVFKLIMLSIYSYASIKSGAALIKSELVIWIFLSPLIVFTYIHCNLFGFMRSIWLNISNTGNWHHLLKIYLFTLIIPISLDIFLSFIALSVMGWFSWQSIGFYFATLILCLFVGFASSIYKPIYLKEVFSFGQSKNVSMWVSIPLIMMIGGLTLAKSSLLIIPFFLIALAVPIYYLWQAVTTP